MSLFTEDSPAPVADMGIERTGRFVLHRAGIRNVWQYDDTLLLFASGRLLLRGKNGAGKSKAMEMLLPFLLDGDTRNIDAVRKDRTNLHWLMTDGREPGNHIGYMWLELRAVADDGTSEYRTLGCGIKASTSTGRPTPWFFFTPKRVGVDLAVDDVGGMLTQDAFRAQLDPEEYFTTGPSYAARIARDIFGIEDLGRYRNLCHLLYQLRRPSVGENIEAGEHTRVLSDALPELDDELINSVASSFDDLKQIRDDLTNAERTERAVAEFLTSYRDYARTVLRARAGIADEAADAADSARRALTKADEEAEAARVALEDADAAVDDLEATEANARAELEVLRAQPAYTQAQALDDRRRRVEAHRGQALTSEQSAERARNHECDAAGRATDAAADIDTETAALNGVRLGPLLEAARLDSGLAPAALTVTDLAPEAEDQPQIRRAGATGPVSHHEPRRVDTAALNEALDSVVARTEQLRSASDSRRRNAEVILADVRKVDDLDKRAARVEQAAADVEGQVNDAATAEQSARSQAVAAEAEWRARLSEWRALPGAARVGGEWPDLAPYMVDPESPDANLLGPGDLDDVEAIIDRAFGPAQADAQAAHVGAIADHRQADGELRALRVERDRVTARSEQLPDPSKYRAGKRDPASGAPFYALVDFAEGLTPGEQAGLEAALQAAGLLDAWVGAEGTTAGAAEADRFINPEPLPAGTATLTSVLTVALPPNCPVPAERVEDLLTSVALGALGSASWMAADGTFGLGVLAGRWAKPTAEYVGVGARRAARERALAELAERIDIAEGAVTAAASRMADAADLVDQLTAARRAWPSSRDFLNARVAWETRREVTTAARSRHRELTIEAQAARDEHRLAERRLRQDAAAADVPHTSGELRQLIETLKDLGNQTGRLRDTAVRVQRAITAHQRAVNGWETAAATRQEAEDAARIDLDRWQNEVSALATLEDACGEDARAVMDQIAATEADRDAATKALPKARRNQSQATTRKATTAERAAQTRQDLTGREAHARHSAESLARVLAAPGLHLAAYGPDVAGFSFSPGQPGAALTRSVRTFAAEVAAAAAGGPDVSDSVILRRYEQLGPGLAGGYDAAADETEDGVKIFELHDDLGHHPIAVIAQRLAGEVAEAKRRLTHRQEEVFQRYLLGELGDHLRRQLNDADTLVQAMNQALAPVRTSHGLGVRLGWQPGEDAPAEAVEAIPLLRVAPGMRSAEHTARLGELLGILIEAARLADPTASYEAHLHKALDYRKWHSFTIRVIEDAKPGSDRRLTSKLRVSQGEQRVLAYLSLFSGAAAYFDSLKRKAPRALRVILLDDAFAKIDEPTHARLLNLLRDLDLDFIITSERVTGCVPGLSLEIYECLRDPQLRGVATVHTHWDGHRAQLQLA